MNFLNLIFVIPTLYQYTEHRQYSHEDNTYVCIEYIGNKELPNTYCLVKKLFWKIYLPNGRPWGSWESCFIKLK